MRVLHICPYMHPSAGGPPIVVERLCSLTPLDGWDASVITTSLYCEDDGNKLQNCLRRRIDALVLPIRRPRILKRPAGAYKAVDKAVRNSDIVHVHTLWDPLNTIARQACERYGRKYVIMPHGMLDPYSLGQRHWLKKIYLAVAERHNLEGASRLIFTTRIEKQSAEGCLPWLARGEVISLGADCPPDTPRQVLAETFLTMFPQTLNRRCLLFLGRIHPKKGLKRLVRILPKIISKHPTILLVVAGGGQQSHVGEIEKLVHSANLGSHVLFTGVVAGATKWAALACAELFILPSSQENFAISVAEAMHMAVPIVITNKVQSWPLVEKANAGLIIEDDQLEGTLAERLDELLLAPAKARSMGKRGQDFAKIHFTWPRVARDIVSLYGQVMSE